MLEKDVYLTTVGKSFLSFIYSLSFLEKNHKVIVLDDERLKYGELFIDTFWELEKEFLKAWGKERDIAPLKNLDEYLFKKHVIFVIGDKRVRLGDTPSRNLKELARKPIAKKTSKKAPQKVGVGGMKRFAWDSGETSNFRKTWSKTSCFCYFSKIRFSGPGERGIWGFPK